MKTYHMYHVETISAETKLRDAERQEGRVKGLSGSGGGVEPVFGLRIEERHQRRNAARKMEKMREKVRLPRDASHPQRGGGSPQRPPDSIHKTVRLPPRDQEAPPPSTGAFVSLWDGGAPERTPAHTKVTR